jgi:hypothetical protein
VALAAVTPVGPAQQDQQQHDHRDHDSCDQHRASMPSDRDQDDRGAGEPEAQPLHGADVFVQ